MFRLRYLGAAAALVFLVGCGMPMGYYGGNGYGNGYGMGASPYGSTYGASPYGAAPYGASPYGAAPYGAMPYGVPYGGGEMAAAPPAVINNHIPVPVPVDPSGTTSTYGAYGNSCGTYGANGYYGDGYANRRQYRHHRYHHGDQQTTDPTVPATTTSTTTTTTGTGTIDPTATTAAATGRRGQNHTRQGNLWTNATNSQNTQQTGVSQRNTYGAQTANATANPFSTRGQAVNQQSPYRQRTAMSGPAGVYGAGARGGGMVSAAPRAAGTAGMRTTQGAARTQQPRAANQKRAQ